MQEKNLKCVSQVNVREYILGVFLCNALQSSFVPNCDDFKGLDWWGKWNEAVTTSFLSCRRLVIFDQLQCSRLELWQLDLHKFRDLIFSKITSNHFFLLFKINWANGSKEKTNIPITVAALIFYCFRPLQSAAWKPRNRCHHLSRGRHYLAGVSLSCLHIGMTPPLLCEREESNSLMR